MKWWRKIDPRLIFVHLCVCLFGCGTWVTTSGIFVELPILVDRVPESWDIGSYLTVVIQLANVGPLIYTLWRLIFPKVEAEEIVVYIIVIVGAASSILLSFFWDFTTFVGGVEHSTALLILEFFSAMANCTSAVVFLPFMSVLKPAYLTSYFIGQGLSGLLPGVLALAQGIQAQVCVNVSAQVNVSDQIVSSSQKHYEPSNFTPEIFFYFLCLMCVLCGISFTFLNYLPLCKSQHVAPKSSPLKTGNPTERTYLVEPPTQSNSTVSVKWGNTDSQVVTEITKQQSPSITSAELAILLLIVGWLRALENGVVPSIQTYAFLPYGMESYSLAVDLARIADPIVCFLAFFVPVKSSRAFVILTLLTTFFCSYIITLASLSPSPHLVDYPAGGALAIISQILATGCLTFTRVSLTGVLRDQGKRWLFYCGVSSQVGSFTGALVTFSLVSIAEVFQKSEKCTT